MSKEQLQAQLEILLDLPYETAYQGSLAELRTGSFVKYSEVIKRIAEIRRQLKGISDT